MLPDDSSPLLDSDIDYDKLFDPHIVDPDKVSLPTVVSGRRNGVRIEVTPDKKAEETRAIGPEQTAHSDGMVCNVTPTKQTARSGFMNTSNLVLNQSLTDIWPGKIMPASAISDGSFGSALSPDRLDGRAPADVRRPITLTLYLNSDRVDAPADVSTEIDTPTSDAAQQARTALLANVDDDATHTPAAMDFDVEQVHSESHLALELGLSYGNQTLDITGQFGFDEDRSHNSFLTKFYRRSRPSASGLDPEGEGRKPR